MFEILRHLRLIFISLAIAAIDTWSAAQTAPEGWSAFISELVVVLLMPVWLPKMCILYVVGFCLQTPLIGTHSSLGEGFQLLFYGLGDLLVCFVYFQITQVIRRRWRQVKQNEANMSGRVASQK